MLQKSFIIIKSLEMTHLVSDTFSSLKQLLLQYSFLYQCYSVNYGIMAEDDTVSAVPFRVSFPKYLLQLNITPNTKDHNDGKSYCFPHILRSSSEHKAVTIDQTMWN